MRIWLRMVLLCLFIIGFPFSRRCIAGANMAVDGKDATYWASKFDVMEPVSFTIDLGGRKKLESASISWEFPAKSFAILTTEDGEHWTEAFSTNNNVLKTTHVALPFQYATKARLVMHEVCTKKL